MSIHNIIKIAENIAVGPAGGNSVFYYKKTPRTPSLSPPISIKAPKPKPFNVMEGVDDRPTNTRPSVPLKFGFGLTGNNSAAEPEAIVDEPEATINNYKYKDIIVKAKALLNGGVAFNPKKKDPFKQFSNAKILNN